MPTAYYPSDEFPSPSAVSLEYPDEWQTLPDAAQCLAVVKGVPDGDFLPNVIVSVRRMRRGNAMQAAVAELRQRASVLQDYESIGEEEGSLDGYPSYRMEGSFIDESVGTLAQAIRLTVVDLGQVEDLVQITGTCSGKQVQDTWQQIRDIQASLRISPGSALA